MSLVENTGAGVFATARRGGLTSYEAEFVRAKTAAGVPLSAVSRMLGRNIEALRDHAWKPTPKPGSVEADPKPTGLTGEPLAIVARVLGHNNLSGIIDTALLYDPTLKEQRAKALWSLYVSGFTTADMARWFGLADPTVKKILQDHAERHELTTYCHVDPWKPGETLTDLERRVASAYGFTRARFRSNSRARVLVVARHHFMFLARQAGIWSHKAIARHCGVTDHTTVIHGVRAHAALRGLEVPA